MEHYATTRNKYNGKYSYCINRLNWRFISFFDFHIVWHVYCIMHRQEDI